jgi:hypothetical protein
MINQDLDHPHWQGWCQLRHHRATNPPSQSLSTTQPCWPYPRWVWPQKTRPTTSFWSRVFSKSVFTTERPSTSFLGEETRPAPSTLSPARRNGRTRLTSKTPWSTRTECSSSWMSSAVPARRRLSLTRRRPSGRLGLCMSARLAPKASAS